MFSFSFPTGLAASALFLALMVCGCALVDPIVTDISYRPESRGSSGKGRVVVLGGADMRHIKSLSPGGFSAVMNKVRLHGAGPLLSPHEALRDAVKARLEAQGYTVLASGSEGAGLVACLYAFEADSPLPDIRRAHVAFSLVPVKSEAISEQTGETLGFAEALAPCAASVGMATATKTGFGESMDLAFSDALANAVNGVNLGACLR